MKTQGEYERLVKESVNKRTTRAEAIRLKCLDCCIYQANEVRMCPSTKCPLWRYRMGREEKDDLYNNKPIMNKHDKERLKNFKKHERSL
ncbi:hypothetical protein [Thomasclavelia cocleata]|uniref:hypothetical protein n=1 Tax=Thomasclavelia cocleata TaxID=69824 RepID=UPI002575B0F1|nr:hypothetical protein [Thomasclavelia cocleata]